MSLSRRTLITGTAATAAAGALAGPALLEWAKAWAQTAPWKPEPGAQLSFLRSKAFVQSEDDTFVAIMDAFAKATGVKVTISRESGDDVQPKASVAANTGSGPDLIWGGYGALPHLFPSKCVDVTDVADYLGKKYGGWVPTAVAYGKGSGNKWIGIPVCFNGSVMNYRVSSLRRAGFSKFPETTDEFLEYAKATKKNNTPGGFALGHATGDGTWVHWCLWAHGGNMVDRNDKVILNSPETEKALAFAKALYANMVPGVLSWNDASNNKAFLANEIHWTGNAVSIYVAAKTDPAKNWIAQDMDHANWPVGPVGRPTELQGLLPLLAMNYTKYPQACKSLMAFMMEADQFNKWLEAAQAFLTQSLNAYDANPLWTGDPKFGAFRDVGKRTLTAGGLGSIGQKAATALAEFLLVDMFASYCIGREDTKGAIRTAERRLQRIYR
jgi:multiple sugar transport system substrate-binding protein